MSQTAVKETKAERAERLKGALNPWERRADIERFAREGHATIPAEWSTYFRWWGIYSQGDGRGVTGGSGGEGKSVPYFMVRIRIPNGMLTSVQARVIADLAARHGRGIADLTVRENVQLHWVPVEALPPLFDALGTVGLTTMGACGDDTRNITGCPLAGVDADEIIDASPLVHAATERLNGHPDFYNLPRKFKVSITGCRVWCSYPEVNDVGLTAVTDPRTGEVGFSLRVGGGLSTTPHLARRLDVFVRPDQVVDTVQGVAEVFRDADVLRRDRERARLKFLFLAHGWTPERFREELARRVGFTYRPAAPERPPEDVYRDHVGLHPQRQPGRFYAGIAVLRGRLRAEQVHAVADLAERHGSGSVRTTTMQNLLVLDVPRAEARALAAGVEAIGLRLDASPFWRGIVACTGAEFCKLALTETKGFAAWLVEQLERRLPGFDDHVKLHVTGCPNSCGQHWIADIGIEGKKVRHDGVLVDAYYFCVGGAVGAHQAVARPVGYRVAAAEVPAAIERLLQGYLRARRPGENFRGFCARHTDEELRALLAGTAVEAVARDVPAGPVPHGAEA
jgi:sulfite reductase (ferredoxin)